MKKTASLIMSVVLLMMALNVTAYAAGEKVVAISDADDLASMKDGQSYILTQNIDISEGWTTISEFSGVLDGNGYTVTVPKDAPIFEKLSGTVKNLKLEGDMTLDENDVSDYYLNVRDVQLSVGVLANRAFGATVENVHSSVNVKFTKSAQAPYSTLRVVFGGLFGFASPAYTCDSNGIITMLRKTTINKCSVGGTIDADFNCYDKYRVESVGGVIGMSTFDVDVSNTLVSATITATEVSGYVGGIVAFLYGFRLPSLTGDSGDDPVGVGNIHNVSQMLNITNCIVSSSFTHTYNSAQPTNYYERTGGIVGFAQGVIIRGCAYTGTSMVDAGKVRTILGYGDADNSDWYYIQITSCVDTIDGKQMISAIENTKPFENIIVLSSENNPVVNRDNNAGVSLVKVADNEKALNEFVNANPDAFNYANGELTIKGLEVPKADHTHSCNIAVETEGKLSTGMCGHEDCNIVTNDPYAGFIQFNDSFTRMRVVMVITADEVEVNKNKPFVMKVSVNGKTVSIPDSSLTAYTSVNADGTLYEAHDGYYIFGVIFNFSTSMEGAVTSVDIVYEGESLPVFSGSATAAAVN